MIKITDNRDPKQSKNKEYFSCNFLYKDEQGKKRRTPTKKFYVKTIYEARKLREVYREEMERKLNNITIYTDMTLSEYCDDWQSRRSSGKLLVKGNRVKQSTLTRDSKIELPKIKKLLGNIPVADIVKADIIRAKDELISEGASQSSMHHFEQKLKQILKQAVRDEVLSRNPFDFLDVTSQPKSKERKPLTEGQINILRDSLLENIDGMKVGIYLCIATGMRRGEALGLQWKHIDLDAKTVEVEQQLNDASEIDSTKTEESDGIVPLPTKAVEYLEEWLQIQSQFVEVTPDTFVCSDFMGNHLQMRSFQKFRRELFVQLGLGSYTLHDLRHTQATMLLLKGVDVRTVQKRLRHKSVYTTLGIYAHAISETERRACD